MGAGLNIIVEADTLEKLQTKCIGYHHDHCRTLYFGKKANLPNKYKKLFNINKDYCAIFEEEFPLISKNSTK